MEGGGGVTLRITSTWLSWLHSLKVSLLNEIYSCSNRQYIYSNTMYILFITTKIFQICIKFVNKCIEVTGKKLQSCITLSQLFWSFIDWLKRGWLPDIITQHFLWMCSNTQMSPQSQSKHQLLLKSTENLCSKWKTVPYICRDPLLSRFPRPR